MLLRSYEILIETTRRFACAWYCARTSLRSYGIQIETTHRFACAWYCARMSLRSYGRNKKPLITKRLPEV